MPLVSFQELVAHAVAGRYTVGAFNVFDSDSLLAVLLAAEAERSPVIVQVSGGCRRYNPHFKAFVDAIRVWAADFDVPIGLNHDHCPLAADAMRAIDEGLPSVMFDGSHLPWAENVAATRGVAEYAHARGVWVEAELGRLPGFEDQVFAGNAEFSDPAACARFIAETGCDALAVSVGTSHGGVLADDALPLHFDVLAAIRDAVPAGFPLVLHGAASLPQPLLDAVNAAGARVPFMRNCAEADIARVGAYGVVKANMDVDNHLAWAAALRGKLREERERYDPRLFLKPARDAFQREVAHKLRDVLRTSGKSWLEETRT